jgi:hypothetical protein
LPLEFDVGNIIDILACLANVGFGIWKEEILSYTLGISKHGRIDNRSPAA